MVSIKPLIPLNTTTFDLEAIRCVGDRRSKTVGAAKKAMRVADWVRAQVAAGNDLPQDEWDEQTMFAALQTCAYRATRKSRGAMVTSTERHEWAERWKSIRDHLINRHLGLAFKMLARFQGQHLDRDDLRGEAFLALIRATEGFDPWRGFRFSTYACHAIVRALIQASRKATRQEVRFVEEPEIGQTPPQPRNDELDIAVDRLRVALQENRGLLTERESTVLAGRFPSSGGAGRTLSQIGRAIGLSKERVRQIQNVALEKLRTVLEADPALQ